MMAAPSISQFAPDRDPCDLPEDLIKRAYEIYGETPERRRRKLLELKQQIAKLPEDDRILDTSDVNLIRFLRGRKFDVALALKTTVNLVRFNREHPDWTENHSAREFMYFNSFFQLLKATDKGRVLCVFRPSLCMSILTPEFMEAHPLAIVRSMIWFMNKISFNVHAQVCGGLLLESFEGFTVWDNLIIAQACPLPQQIALMKYVQNCVGFRFCGAYLFHEPQFITWLWYLASGFLQERVRNRFHLCGSDLHRVHGEVDDVRILPVYFGGEVQDGDYDFVREQAEIEEQEELEERETTKREQREREQPGIISLGRGDGGAECELGLSPSEPVGIGGLSLCDRSDCEHDSDSGSDSSCEEEACLLFRDVPSSGDLQAMDGETAETAAASVSGGDADSSPPG